MSRLIADFLRAQSPGRLLAVGALCLLVAGGALASVDHVATLRPLTHLLALLLAVGGVAIGLGTLRLFTTWLNRRPEERRGALVTAILCGVAVSLGVAAFATYSLSFYWKDTRMQCWEAEQADTIAARSAALARGQSRLRSPFSILPELVGFRVSLICAGAERDLQRVAQGQCPWHLLEGQPCRCGNDLYPQDAKCEFPKCAVGQSPERLFCW